MDNNDSGDDEVDEIDEIDEVDGSIENNPFSDCDGREDVRETVARIYNSLVVDAMNEDVDPMFVANYVRDLSGATVVELHRTHERNAEDSSSSSNGNEDNSEDHQVIGGDSHPLG